MTKLTALDGTSVSSLCFGCMQFGGTADAQASRDMFDACRAADVTFFDTAHTYTAGAAEHLLGQFVKPDRDRLIIATKAAYTGGSGPGNITQQFDESRARMGLDMVDILYLHRWDPQTPLEHSFETLAQLQSTGKIRYIGVSNFAAWQVMKAQAVAKSFGTRIDILQPMYSLVKRQAEVELFPMALSERIAVAAYSPLGSGLLTGKYGVEAKAGTGRAGRLASDDRYAARYGQDWMHDTAADLTRLAARMKLDPATLAVAWAAHHPAVTAPIVSARNARQLAASLAGGQIALNAEEYACISDLSPRPAPATDRLEEAAR